jgi:hypothetical protein
MSHSNETVLKRTGTVPKRSETPFPRQVFVVSIADRYTATRTDSPEHAEHRRNNKDAAHDIRITSV